MRIQQLHTNRSGEDDGLKALADLATHADRLLVLAFGSVSWFDRPDLGRALRDAFPNASIVGCTTAGEITHDGVFDDTLTITCAEFESTAIKTSMEHVPEMSDSESAGHRLAEALAAPDLRYVMVLSDGVAVNGSALVKGLRDDLGPDVSVSGGLAGDGGRFERTLVLHAGEVYPKAVAAVAFYGTKIRTGHGSVGGWSVFGPRRKVTKVEENVLYELDGEPVLGMYEHYLGDEARDLPGSGLLYPLAVLSDEREETGLIRTLLGVNREDGSITFAGNFDQGNSVQLMYAEDDQLIDGAAQAARYSKVNGEPPNGTLALLISCVGRKLLLGGEVSREVQAVVGELGQNPTYAGFYSNGEISPFSPTGRCELHNQTMTVTTLSEDAA